MAPCRSLRFHTGKIPSQATSGRWRSPSRLRHRHRRSGTPSRCRAPFSLVIPSARGTQSSLGLATDPGMRFTISTGGFLNVASSVGSTGLATTSRSAGAVEGHRSCRASMARRHPGLHAEDHGLSALASEPLGGDSVATAHAVHPTYAQDVLVIGHARFRVVCDQRRTSTSEPLRQALLVLWFQGRRWHLAARFAGRRSSVRGAGSRLAQWFR